MNVSDRFLQRMLELDSEMSTFPDVATVLDYREAFRGLHQELSNGGEFPRAWITKDAQLQLKPHELSTHISTVNPDPARRSKTVWCGHPQYRGTEFCTTSSCGNYYARHNTAKASTTTTS